MKEVVFYWEFPAENTNFEKKKTPQKQQTERVFLKNIVLQGVFECQDSLRAFQSEIK